MNAPEVVVALAELERQMNLFSRVILDDCTFNTLFDAVYRSATKWDYEPIWSERLKITSYMLRLGHAEELRDQVRVRIAHLVTEQLTEAQR